ncbi:MAG: methyltransferase [Acidobacteriota bacterium]
MTNSTQSLATGESMAGNPLRVLKIANAFLETQIVYVAIHLDIIELVSDGIDTVEAIATRVDANPDGLGRLLRGLAWLELLEEQITAGTRHYRVTPLGMLIRRGQPLRDVIEGNGHWGYRAVADLLHAVKTGEPVYEVIFGATFFEYQNRDSVSSRNFNAIMSALTKETISDVLAAYDFAQSKLVVDLGGNTGTMLLGLLTAHPHLQGVVFDRPVLEEAAIESIHKAGQDDRCRFQPGDFFKQVIPAGADCYILSQILHDWTDDDCIRILEEIRLALPDNGRLLIVEQLLPERVDGQSAAVVMDLYMLVTTGGRERTEGQYRQLLEAAGFDLAQTYLRPDSPRAVLEAVPSAS